MIFPLAPIDKRDGAPVVVPIRTVDDVDTAQVCDAATAYQITGVPAHDAVGGDFTLVDDSLRLNIDASPAEAIGCDMRAINGDSGYFGNIEIRTAPRPLFHHCQDLADGDQFSMHTFYDFGDSYNHTLLPGEQSGVDLGSVGLGMRYSYSRYLSLRGDYGWQTVGLLIQPQPRERIHLGVVASY